MRVPLLTFLACAALLACDSGPSTAADVAGVYVQVSQNGVGIPGGGVQSGFLELKPDGTLSAEWVIDRPFAGEGLRDTTTTSGSFTLGAYRRGCLSVSVHLESEPEEPGAGTLCDDRLALVGGRDTLVFLLRQQ